MRAITIDMNQLNSGMAIRHTTAVRRAPPMILFCSGLSLIFPGDWVRLGFDKNLSLEKNFSRVAQSRFSIRLVLPRRQPLALPTESRPVKAAQ